MADLSGWSDALDALESDLERLEEADLDVDVADREPWQPPPVLGHLPPALQPRARQLLARQTEVIERLSATVSGNRQEARMTASVRAATGTPGRAAYLDVRA